MHKQTMYKNTLRRWLRSAAGALACAALLASPSLAQAQGNSASHASAQGLAHGRAHQVSFDLGRIINGAGISHARWARDTAQGRLVQVIISADNTGDRNLTSLRKAIIKAGGSVHRRYDSLGTLSALLPAAAVAAIAARNDVITISPAVGQSPVNCSHL